MGKDFFDRWCACSIMCIEPYLPNVIFPEMKDILLEKYPECTYRVKRRISFLENKYNLALMDPSPTLILEDPEGARVKICLRYNKIYLKPFPKLIHYFNRKKQTFGNSSIHFERRIAESLLQHYGGKIKEWDD